MPWRILLLCLILFFMAQGELWAGERVLEGLRSVTITLREAVSGVMISSEKSISAQKTEGLTPGCNLRDQKIKVLEGEAAFLSIGKSLPFTREMAVWAGRSAGVKRSVEYRDVGTEWMVSPRFPLQNLLELKISARSSEAEGEGLRYQKVLTTLRMERGKWYDLAQSISGNPLPQNRGLVLRAGRSDQIRSIRIRAEW